MSGEARDRAREVTRGHSTAGSVADQRRRGGLVTRRLSLAGQLLALQVVIIFVVLVGVTAVTVAESTLGAHESEGRRAQAIAETLAGSRALRNSLADGSVA